MAGDFKVGKIEFGPTTPLNATIGSSSGIPHPAYVVLWTLDEMRQARLCGRGEHEAQYPNPPRAGVPWESSVCVHCRAVFVAAMKKNARTIYIPANTKHVGLRRHLKKCEKCNTPPFELCGVAYGIISLAGMPNQPKVTTYADEFKRQPR